MTSRERQREKVYRIGPEQLLCIVVLLEETKRDILKIGTEKRAI